MLVPVFLPIISNHSAFFGKLFVVGDNHTGIPESPEIFGWVKAETTHCSKRTNFLVFICCSVGLGAVFYHMKFMFFGYSDYIFYICRLTVQVYRNNCTSFFCNFMPD